MYSSPLLLRHHLFVHSLLLLLLHPPLSSHLFTHSLSIKPTTTPTTHQPPHLPSIFPPDTPPGLRGEAVRTSLRTRGLYYTTSSFQSSLLTLKGTGTLPFLNSKFTTSFVVPPPKKPYATNSCYLTSRGRIDDLISVVVTTEDHAMIVTSPSSQEDLYAKLERLIFPMDGVTLERSSMVGYTIVSTDEKRVDRILSERCRLPSFDDTNVARWDDEGWVIRDVATQLPSCAARGYTFLLPPSSSLPNTLLSPSSTSEPPLEIGLAEWNTLRIRAGYPCRHFEMTGDVSDKIKSNPLELCLPVDDTKGCYLGQEGIAAILKNARGPARKLYLVMFDDEDNDFEDDMEEEDGEEMIHEQPRRLPCVGDELSVLGSKDEITVGVLTSVAERGSTGERCVAGLALIKRSDGILKKMREAGLDPPKEAEVEDEFFGIVKDPLEGLEVIVKGSYVMGRLRVIPRWRYRRGGSMWDDGTAVVVGEEDGIMTNGGPSAVMGYMQPQQPVIDEETDDDDDGADPERLLRQAEDAAREAEAAAAEAKRKAEKMELLKKRAAEAMAKRKKKAQ